MFRKRPGDRKKKGVYDTFTESIIPDCMKKIITMFLLVLMVCSLFMVSKPSEAYAYDSRTHVTVKIVAQYNVDGEWVDFLVPNMPFTTAITYFDHRDRRRERLLPAQTNENGYAIVERVLTGEVRLSHDHRHYYYEEFGYYVGLMEERRANIRFRDTADPVILRLWPTDPYRTPPSVSSSSAQQNQEQAPAQAQQGARPHHDIAIRIDGAYLTDLDVAPIISDGRTLIPVRAVSEALGADVGWNPETRTVTIERADTTIRMTIASLDAAVVHGGSSTNAQLEVAPVIIDGRTMLPIRFIAETFGLTVNWDASSRTVIIVT